MTSSAPINMAVSADSGFLRKLPLVFDPMLPPAPQIFNEPPLKNPGDLQEEQLQFTTSILDAEVSDHNKTREKLQRFMGQSLAHERALCTERGVVKYLNTLIQGLKNQIHAETVKRVAAEEEKHALIAQNEMMGDYCGEYTSDDCPETRALENEELLWDGNFNEFRRSISGHKRKCMDDDEDETGEGSSKRRKV